MSLGDVRDIHVAIACGGTGGHLFPGLAVGRELRSRGVGVTLLVSPKAVDREAVTGVADVPVAVLPPSPATASLLRSSLFLRRVRRLATRGRSLPVLPVERHP